MVPGKARVLSLNTPTASSAGAPAAIAPSGTGASRPATPLEDQRVGSVPDLARLPRSLGKELSLSYAGAHLSLTWQRSTDGVSVEVHVPEPIEGELALWHQRQALARWAVTVVPGDPLTLHWPGVDLDAGELGVEVRDTDGNVLARCGTVP